MTSNPCLVAKKTALCNGHEMVSFMRTPVGELWKCSRSADGCPAKAKSDFGANVLVGIVNHNHLPGQQPSSNQQPTNVIAKKESGSATPVTSEPTTKSLARTRFNGHLVFKRTHSGNKSLLYWRCVWWKRGCPARVRSLPDSTQLTEYVPHNHPAGRPPAATDVVGNAVKGRRKALASETGTSWALRNTT